MKTLCISILLLSIGVTISSCQPEEIEPNDPITTPPPENDTTGTGGDTTIIYGNIEQNSFKFYISTNALFNDLDSVVITKTDGGTGVNNESFVIYPNDIDLNVGDQIKFSALKVIPTITFIDDFIGVYTVGLYLKTTTTYGGSTGDVFELGINSQPCSDLFTWYPNQNVLWGSGQY